MTNMSQKATTIRFPDPYSLKVIDKAAELTHQTRTGFLISIAVEKAEEIIKQKLATKQEVENLMLLSPEASQHLAERLLKPSKPNKALMKAMHEYEEMVKNG